MIIRNSLKKFTAVILCVCMLVQTQGMSVCAATTGQTNDESQEVNQTSVQDAETQTPSSAPEGDSNNKNEEPATEGDSNNENEESATETQVSTTTDNISQYLKDDRICIYNYEQLLKMGSGETIYTGDIDGNVGTGDVVQVDGTVLTYGTDKNYYFMNDMQVDATKPWTYPESMTGTIASGENKTDTTVYDKSTDTIYIYNRYQLALINSETAEEEVVMSDDATPERVGMGNVILLDDGSKLTYGKSHNYVIASNFTTDTPELLASTLTMNPSDKYPSNFEGRDYFGQVVREIEGKQYILIGNNKQLRAIGTDKKVTEPIWQVYWEKHSTGVLGSEWVIVDDNTEFPIKLYYPGDADLIKFDDTYDWSNTDLYADNNGGHAIGSNDYWDVRKKCYSYYGSKLDENNMLTYDENAKSNNMYIGNGGTQLTYSTDANYIIFRDIYLTDTGTADGTTVAWDPIESFTGTMKGQLGMEAGKNATIHNVLINQTQAINQSSYKGLSGNTSYAEYGVGFFRDLATSYSSTLQFQENPVEVSNLTLDNVSVKTSTQRIKQDFSLLGTVLTVVLGILGLKSGVERDPKSLATGALAGVVRGNVKIENCKVTGLAGVENANDWTGGLVGYASGITKYEALTGALSDVVNALSTLLNYIPVLGLGDLVTVLLNGGVLKVGNLIPVGYTNAVLTGCTVEYQSGAGVSGQKYSGGLIGETKGVVLTDCAVTTAGNNQVLGTDYAGGFIGKASNQVISGLLQNLGVDVLGNFPVNTAVFNSRIDGAGTIDVSASSTADESGYAGGFIGSMSNSYAVDCKVTCLGNVSGHEYVGGFTGKADMGNLADIDENKGLLGLVKNLLSTILTGDSNMQLLNLVGLRPSVIAGSSISGNEMNVTASGKYAGGFVAYAGAVQISNTNALNDSSKTTSSEIARVLQKNGLGYAFGDNRNSIDATSAINVTSTTEAGGVLGSAKMTSVGDVLGGAVKAADYMRFELKDMSVDGGTTGLSVSSTADNGHAGGVIGQGIGGEVSNVSVKNLQSVDAVAATGGFAGYFGSGKLADVGGVNLLGLDILKVDGLLTVADMIKTFANNCSVEGIASGCTVNASADSGKAGGFIGYAVSGRTSGCGIRNLKSVTTSKKSGKAGGFVGYAKAGDALATVGESVGTSGLPSGIQLENVLGVVSALTPEFDNSVVAFTPSEQAQVTADMAGGFLGDGEAVDINYSVNHSSTGTDSAAKTEITGLQSIVGTTYAGGFAGRFLPGDVAQTGSIKLLGLLNATQLLSVMDVSYPQISNSSITGDNLIVTAEGITGNADVGDAGGFVGNGKAVTIENSDVLNVKQVTGAYHAGGYIGMMRSGSVAEAGDATGDLINSILGKILSISELAGVLQAASCEITNSKVSGIETGMTVKEECRSDNTVDSANGYAGGYVGEMQSGIVDNQSNAVEGSKGTAVENLIEVTGLRYAGGFGGLVKAGSVAEVGSDLSVLTQVLQATDLLSVINAFVPIISHASVCSVPDGFSVRVTGKDTADTTNDKNTGSSGGYIGYACGVQISNSDVNKIKNTAVTEPKDLQSTDGSTYYSEKSSYGVQGYRNAGGYFGKVDLGSTASIGGTTLLSKLLTLSDTASALSVVVSMVEHSDVYGAVGGFNVLATDSTGLVGKAGGYAGNALGSQFQDCNVYSFAHIIGRESAGGYAGTIEPGAVANALGNVSILNGLIKADNLLGVLRTFVPTIKNSETTCIPCGGAVRADAESKDGIKRGLAGGYVGYNFGGQIWGNNTDNWKGTAYAGTTRTCAVQRLRSVYGVEYAGGYTGLMECANVADTGSLSVLNGVIKLDNPLTAVQAVYPTEEQTAVYGPLRNLDMDTWNAWVTHVGKYGSYGQLLQGLGTVQDQNTLDTYINQYAYGYSVTAGRNSVAEKTIQGSAAGGYVGRMEGGTITDAVAKDLKEVDAYRSAAGFVGEMITGSVAQTGDISLGSIDVVGAIPVLQTFVPVIKNSQVEGYQSGASIIADGVSSNNTVGISGGYVGNMIGGQIWGDETTKCSISNLRRVDGTSYVGGFAGKVDPGSAAKVDTATNQGLLNQILNKLIPSPEDLIKVLNATVATIRYAEATAWDDWGIVVNGTYQDSTANTAYAKAVGGFAGSLSGTVVGEEKTANSGVQANQIRSVVGGEYAGGFFGLADVAAVAEVSGSGETSILGIIQSGSIDALDSFRTYVYHSTVSGCKDAGLSVAANTEVQSGQGVSLTYSGDAGGFGGALLDGSVKDSKVTNLSNVNALNHGGGFIGYSGKSGVVDVDKVDVLGDAKWQLLGGSLGVLDVFGSNIHDSSVSGMPGGYTVKTNGGQDEIAGGFVGYGDLARIVNCKAGEGQQVNGLKQVSSGGIAGGFAGKTNYAYLGDIQLKSTLVNAILTYVLNPLIKVLYLGSDQIESSNLLNINLGIIKVKALCDGNVASVDLLGLKIAVSLSKKSTENQQETDVAIITIGDSTIKLPCTSDGLTGDNEQNIRITLIKANRTKIESSDVQGIAKGYDVYGGNAGNSQDGTGENGYSGGFIGYNNEGLLLDNNMYFCDVVRGTENKVGPFTGISKLDSSYDFNTLSSVEGNNNLFRIYRSVNQLLDEIKVGSSVLNSQFTSDDTWNTYTMEHIQKVKGLDTLKNAEMESNSATTAAVPLNAYISPAKAVLMDDVNTTSNTGSTDTPEPPEIQDPCDELVKITINKVWKDVRNQDKIRPDNITVTLHRSWTEDGIEKSEVVAGYLDYPISGLPTDNSWQAFIQDLPAYTLDANKEPCYYTYSVTETEIKDYTTKITASGDHYTFTITNSHFSVLPDTGGVGIIIFLLAGGAILVLLHLTKRKRKDSKVGVMNGQ